MQASRSPAHYHGCVMEVNNIIAKCCAQFWTVRTGRTAASSRIQGWQQRMLVQPAAHARATSRYHAIGNSTACAHLACSAPGPAGQRVRCWCPPPAHVDDSRACCSTADVVTGRIRTKCVRCTGLCRSLLVKHCKEGVQLALLGIHLHGMPHTSSSHNSTLLFK
jgi:hypothetical protein